MLLAQTVSELELLRGLSQNWPILATFIGALWWFARYIAQPLTARHIAFIDAVEERDRIRLTLDAENTALLGILKDETQETNSRLSTMDKRWKCPMEGQTPPLQPHGGA